MSPVQHAGIPDAFWRDPVERAKTDPAAFGELYDRYSARIYRFVRSRIHDDGLAEDVTADVFMSALRGIRNYQDQGRPFSCWLYRIAANAVASHYRNRRPQLSLDDAIALPALEMDPADEVIARDRVRAVWQAIDRLPRQQRAAMILKFSDDLTMEDVGAVLGKSPAAAKLLIYRAVQRLRLELARDLVASAF
ncbi:MAG: sigma-70 family RNA polymerase sigma factor [Chloroflexota bacterium]|nr:MAG: sigma-70 family RNA polymerase sigma factor [Chloroflexota bacterium]TMD84014.1 MAG: sigma-70 family RNA polymerase sigma factor [Chloroflexota bacterium]